MNNLKIKFKNMITYLDNQIGELIQKLKEWLELQVKWAKVA